MTDSPKVIRGTPFAVSLDEELRGQNASPHVKPLVQLLKTGDFTDPRYGNFEITSKTLIKLKENFDNKVRRIDIMIDFAHASDLEAAGWIKALELREDDSQLWAVVDWTPSGRKRLADKEFRYLSADFVQDYQDNESLKKFGPCLLGAGLTNRPVIKGMDPVIELQEGKGHDMAVDEKKFKEMSDALEGLQGKHKELEEKHAKLASEYAEFQKKSAGKDGDDSDDDSDADKKPAGDDDDDADSEKKELSELRTEVTKLKEGKELAEKKSTFAKLLAEGKAIPAQEESFLKGDMVKFAELGGKALNLKGQGHGGAGSGTDDKVETNSQKVLKLAQKRLGEKSSTNIGDAISVVLSENPTLAEGYQSESLNNITMKGV